MQALSVAKPSLEIVDVQVYRSADDLARAFESSSRVGTTVRYEANIIPHTDPPEIHYASRFFNPSEEENLQDLLRAWSGTPEEVEVISDEEMEELRYERIEDVEGWETEEEDEWP